MSNRQPGDWRLFCIIVGLFAVAWVGALIFTMPSAQAFVTNTQPYGGCKEAWPEFIHTDGAQDCRDKGWVIRRHLIVSPSGVARTDLRPCRQEDSERCYWNATVRGNGKGRGFITNRKFYWYVDTINGELASTNLLYRYDRHYR